MKGFVITHSGSTYHYLEYHHSSLSVEDAIDHFRLDFPDAFIHRVCVRLPLKNLNTK